MHASGGGPLLFVVSEPQSSPEASQVALRLQERGLRTWLGSLAPAGLLSENALTVMKEATAVLLLLNDSASRSREVERHLMVARQTRTPIISLRLSAVDQGLLRRELLDAEWVEGPADDAALAEIARRAYRMESVATGEPGPVRPEMPREPGVPDSRGSLEPRALVLALAALLLVAVVGLGIALLLGPSVEFLSAEADQGAADTAASASSRPEQTDGAVPSEPDLPMEVRPQSPTAHPRQSDSKNGDRRDVRTGLRSGLDPVSTVRGFYEALAHGDGETAALHVVPYKRHAGPLSAEALSRYYSALERPLRLERVRLVGESTVLVSYDYTLRGGRACRGEAAVDVVTGPQGESLIERIRTAGPC
jgi:hypothetical protein